MSQKRQPASTPPPRRRARRDPEAGLLVRSLALGLPSGHRIDAHDHAWPQLVYAAAGALSVEASGGEWVVPADRAVWVPEGVPHAVTATGRVAMRTLYLRPDLAAPLPRRCGVVSVSPLLRELVLEVVRRGMLDEGVPEEARLAAVVVDQIARTEDVPLALPELVDARAKRVATRVLARLDSTADLAALAAGSGASARTLERLFLAETGLTFGRWRQRARLLQALRLLASGESVTATALAVGYDSPSAFIAMFKRALGRTPRG